MILFRSPDHGGLLFPGNNFQNADLPVGGWAATCTSSCQMQHVCAAKASQMPLLARPQHRMSTCGSPLPASSSLCMGFSQLLAQKKIHLHMFSDECHLRQVKNTASYNKARLRGWAHPRVYPGSRSPVRSTRTMASGP